MQVNIDGLPLFKSSKVQFWPILGKIIQPVETRVFVIGLFSGTEKPKDVDEFLHDFVDEMKTIADSGICVNSSVYPLHLRCFICDAPARAFVKQVKGHTG
jgi:hypothetical protein